MKRILLIAILALASTAANAEYMFDLSVFYDSQTQSDVTYTTTNYYLFGGMAFGSKQQFYIGPNYTSDNRNTTGGGTTTTEIGLRANYYFNTDKNYVLVVGLNPSVTTETTDAKFSYIAGLGYEAKVTTNFFLGATVMYHAFAGGKVPMSSIRPTIDLCFRFK